MQKKAVKMMLCHAAVGARELETHGGEVSTANKSPETLAPGGAEKIIPTNHETAEIMA